jgi:hypothetical protein
MESYGGCRHLADSCIRSHRLAPRTVVDDAIKFVSDKSSSIKAELEKKNIKLMMLLL